MNSSELKERISKLNIWKKDGERAPHKPLLILYALGRLQREKTRFIPYGEAREKLKQLLMDFGPVRKSYHPEQPFARLINDGIWELNTSVDTIKDGWLLSHSVLGGFSQEVYSLLVENYNVLVEITEILLEEHFPETIHEDILLSVGLDIGQTKKRIRDGKFRDSVLRAYEYSCAVCGFDVRLRNNLIALEAAHIKWHQAGGPDTEENGIALCSLHHKLFDRGVFTLTNDRKLLVAEEAHGTQGFEEWLMRFHGKHVRLPIHPEYHPKELFLNWHVREVFRGPARYHSI